MPLTLFQHNEEAYQSVLSMFKTVGRAAVIHPTGTGKGFIGFKLCEEHPNQKVWWLSPSAYIFRTQLENLRKVSGGWKPGNIRFLTYAKAMNLDFKDLEGLQGSAVGPDYIILDEFHRCGARQWGQGVQRLLNAFPKAKVLGLSATAVRYLDNQRDMAEELFGNCIASEMTLGESIVRGILRPPKYVMAAYSCQKQLERYRRKIEAAKNAAVRREAEECLEELRRALEKADGLDQVFARHMPDFCGKYLIFCRDYDHLCEMTKLAGEWFQKIDKEPHVYQTYSEDPGSSRAFAEFMEDNSGHLKLLYSIDMFNEGIHVEDLSGVILLRPTISPIVYKQQIGRAMAAGKQENTVIFDIVLNIENLCSIGAVEEEMESAMTDYHAVGRSESIVNECFQVTDEVKDCLRLFEKLNETLSASWDLMYEAAEKYYRENGDLEVPRRYVTEEGLSLGSWVNTQRMVHEKKAAGILTRDQEKKLDALGMRWGSCQDALWEKYYKTAAAYYAEHGNLLVKVGEIYHGVELGRWIARLRNYRKDRKHSAYLIPERIKVLNEIGMVWDVPKYQWERNYAAAVRYRRKHGNLRVPAGYVDEDGIRLGRWIRRQREAGRNTLPLSKEKDTLDEERIGKLNAIGMVWKLEYGTIKSRRAAGGL